MEGEYARKRAEIIAGSVEDVSQAVEAVKKARAGIGDWLQGLLLGSLSPLTAQQKLDEARKQYLANLTLSQSGDVNALGQYTTAAQNYLDALKAMYGSGSEYLLGFMGVQADAGGLAIDHSGPVTSAGFSTGVGDIVQAIEDLQARVLELNRTVEVSGDKTSGSIDRAVKDGALTF